MTYEDVAPYYDKTEALIGVFGSKEGLENTPDGIFQPPPKPRAYELPRKRACVKLEIPVIPSRLAILTRPMSGRQACFYATDCGRGCSIKANFQSTTVLLPPAIQSGNLDLITAKTSVLNQFCQAWEVKNLFVTAGGCFVSNADKNPTLSIMAIAWRGCEYLLEELKKGNV